MNADDDAGTPTRELVARLAEIDRKLQFTTVERHEANKAILHSQKRIADMQERIMVALEGDPALGNAGLVKRLEQAEHKIEGVSGRLSVLEGDKHSVKVTAGFLMALLGFLGAAVAFLRWLWQAATK